MFSLTQPDNFRIIEKGNNIYQIYFPLNIESTTNGFLYDECNISLVSNSVTEVTEEVNNNYDNYFIAAKTNFDSEMQKRQINILKNQLSASDYKILKTVEKFMTGSVLPYDISTLIYDRETLRNDINIVETNDTNEIDLLAIEKDHKISEMNATCQVTIVNGITIGEGCYSLNTFDQINLSSLGLQAQMGLSVPYHANGKLCRLYEPTEFLSIVNSAVDFITYHTTYLNALKKQIMSLTTVEEVQNVNYGMELTGEFLESFNSIINHS